MNSFRSGRFPIRMAPPIRCKQVYDGIVVVRMHANRIHRYRKPNKRIDGRVSGGNRRIHRAPRFVNCISKTY